MSAERLAKLLQAIDLARPGACRYVGRDGTPQCVIGQLAALEGVPVATMRGWDGATDWGSKSIYEIDDILASDLRVKYGVELLSDLQECWDVGQRHYADDVREELRKRARAGMGVE